MCILAIKPSGVMNPSDTTLKEMFNRNPDGAGICYNAGGKIKIIKGLMNVEAFIKAVHSIPVDATALIHARISTGGGVCPELTHPYPLTNKYEELTATTLTIKDGFAVGHNGIFSGFTNSQGYNDTVQFIGSVLKPLNDMAKGCGKTILDKQLDTVINRLVTGSRLAIMDGDGNYQKYGSGWTEDNGVWYSNSSYKPYTYTYSYNSAYNKYGYYDYDDYKGLSWNNKEKCWEKDTKSATKEVKSKDKYPDSIMSLCGKHSAKAAAIKSLYDIGYTLNTIETWLDNEWI